MTEKTKTELAVRSVASTDVFGDSETFALAQRVGQMFASSQLVPKHLQGQPADCIIAFAMARRLNEDPLVVLQSIYIVNGSPGWKTTYMIARANQSGLLKGRINWTVEGKGNTLSIKAFATLADGDRIEIGCDMAMAQAEGWTKNPKYKSMPEVMLRYRSAAMLIRMYLPEVMLGLPTVEELETHEPAPREVVNAVPDRAKARPSGRSALGINHPEPVESPEPEAEPAEESPPTDIAALKAALKDLSPNADDIIEQCVEEADGDEAALAEALMAEIDALTE